MHISVDGQHILRCVAVRAGSDGKSNLLAFFTAYTFESMTIVDFGEAGEVTGLLPPTVLYIH